MWIYKTQRSRSLLDNDQIIVLVVHRPAVFTGNSDVACALVASVLTSGVAGSTTVCAGHYGEGLIALVEVALVVCACITTDAFNELRRGLDEGVGVLAVVAARLGDLARAHLFVTDVLVHVAVDVLGDKLLVALADHGRLAVSTQGDRQKKPQGKQQLVATHHGG